MTYIGRFEASTGAHHTRRKLDEARRQLEHSFPADDRRKIPQVKELFTKIDEATEAADALSRIFIGNGTHTVADFIPDETGTSKNDREMDERDAKRGLF